MCAVPSMAVFCSSLTSCFLGMLLTYFLCFYIPHALYFYCKVIIIVIIIIIIIIIYSRYFRIAVKFLRSHCS